MTTRATRRSFLHSTSASGAALCLGEWAALAPVSPARAEDARVTPDLVRFGPDLEPVVRLIEDTPREKCPAAVLGQLRDGLPYRRLLAALFLANLRTLGMAHPLAALHSANQLALDLPVQERLLPAFWALDSFKYHQERGRQAPSLRPLAGGLPPADRAEEELHAGMAAYDPDRVERAVVALARAEGAHRVAEPLWRYGARDWAFIGHQAIWVANTWQTLRTVGWRHAEPALRVLGPSIVGSRAGLAHQPYAANDERVRGAIRDMPPGWPRGGGEPGLTRELLELIRSMQTDEACGLALERLRAGKAEAGAVWDAVHLAAGEIYLNQPTDGGSSLHANTASAALHTAFRLAADPANRLLILLQAVGWTCLYRGNLADNVRRGNVKDTKALTDLTPADVPGAPEEAAAAVLAARSSDPVRAARLALGFARRHPDSDALRTAACRLLPLKATWDPHDVKFPVAMLEKQGWVTPPWRPYLMAAAALSFKGSDDPDMPIVHRVRDAIRTM